MPDSPNNSNTSLGPNISRRASIISNVTRRRKTLEDIENFERDNKDYLLRDDLNDLNEIMNESNMPEDEELAGIGEEIEQEVDQELKNKNRRPSNYTISERNTSKTELNDLNNDDYKYNHSGSESSVASTNDDYNSYRPEALPNNNSTNQNNDDNDTIKDMPRVEKTGTRYFSPHLKEQRKKVFWHFIRSIFCLMLFIFIVFTIFWGSTYRTNPYYHKLHFLAVIQEDNVDDLPVTNITPITSVVPGIISEIPGTWHVYNSTGFAEKQKINTTTEAINNEIIHLIYKEDFWVAVNFKPNATRGLYDALVSQNSASFNSSEYFQFVYESGRDPSNLKAVILPVPLEIEVYLRRYFITQYLPSLYENITASNNATVNSMNLARSGSLTFELFDYRPFYDRLLLVVTQIGCVYCLILTVFQFMLFSPLHAEMAKLLKSRSRIYYRIGISFCIHFFLSLFFCTVTAMYQVDFTRAFGKGGFMVYWMSTYMFMLAVGGANENMVSIIFAVAPQFLGFWILGFVALNLCTAFFPLAMNSNFYRWGYMMPLHNLVDLHRVTFLNVSRWKMGRNYGIFAAWIVVNIILLPFAMKLSTKIIVNKMKKQAKAEIEKEENPE